MSFQSLIQRNGHFSMHFVTAFQDDTEVPRLGDWTCSVEAFIAAIAPSSRQPEPSGSS